MEISEIIKEARIKKGMTQQELADSVYVTRQTISKWELGKSVPDEASLNLLSQRLELDEQKKKEIKHFYSNKQLVLAFLIGGVFSLAVLGIRYVLFKMGKLEDKKFMVLLKSIGFVLLVLYFRLLLDRAAYLLLFLITVGYIIYQFYLISLERHPEEPKEDLAQQENE